jgi:hypothetical protein
MAQETTAGLETLRSIVPQLNSAVEEASSVVQAVDRFLSEELGISTWAASRPFDQQRAIGDDGRELLVTSHLACGKVAGRYRLHVLTATLDKPEGKEQFTHIVNEERIPWSSLPRDVKLQSFVMLPELLNILASRVSEIASQTSRTVEAVWELLGNMGHKGADFPADDFVVSSLAANTTQNLFKRPRPK